MRHIIQHKCRKLIYLLFISGQDNTFWATFWQICADYTSNFENPEAIFYIIQMGVTCIQHNIDVMASIKLMESMECMYEKVSRRVTFSGIHRNTQIIVMW